MEKIKCKHCGSSYVDLIKTVNGERSKERTYYCSSCKKEFVIKDEENKASGDLIARFESNDYGYEKESFIEVYRDANGKISVYQYESYYKKYLKRNVTPRIFRGSLDGGFGNKPYIVVSTWAPHVKEDPNGATVYVKKIKLNPELTKKAMSNEAMRAAWTNERTGFVPSINAQMLDDMISWMESNLGLRGGSSFQQYGCYVATAVYGSYDCPQVWTLRRFRDYTLAETWFGRAFIHCYYAISPHLVRWFGEYTWFNNLWKPMLDRLVQRLNTKGVPNTPYRDRPWF